MMLVASVYMSLMSDYPQHLIVEELIVQLYIYRWITEVKQMH